MLPRYTTSIGRLPAWRMRLSMAALLAICLLGWAPAEVVYVQGTAYTQSLYWQYSAWPVGGIVVLALLMLAYAQWRSGRWLRGLAWYTALVVLLFGSMRWWQLWQSRPYTAPAWGLYAVLVLGLALLLLNTRPAQSHHAPGHSGQ